MLYWKAVSVPIIIPSAIGQSAVRVLKPTRMPKVRGDHLRAIRNEKSPNQAKTELSRLLPRVAAGEGVVIARRGQPVARLVACTARVQCRPDVLKGKVVVPDTFFDPLPEDELATWEGR